MAASLIGGLIPDTIAPDSIIVAEPNKERRTKLVSQFGVQVTADNNVVCQNSDVVVLAVKPHVMPDVVKQLTGYQNQTLFISIAAGINITSLQAWLGTQHPVVRVMPNTPALIGIGASALYASGNVSEEKKKHRRNNTRCRWNVDMGQQRVRSRYCHRPIWKRTCVFHAFY